MSDGNDVLPDGWAEVPIGDLCDLINGRAFKPKEWTESGLPIIRIQNLNNPEAKFNHYAGEYADKHLVRPGELLFAWSGTPGTSFGAHVWQGCEALLNQHIFRVLIPEDDLHKTYFRFAINHKLEELIGKAHGGVGLRHVTKGKFQATKVTLPPLAEQRRIVSKIESLQERSSRARRALSEVGPLLEQFRQSVLRAAFSGRLTADWRAEHPNVEPASELLARIRTERRHHWEQSELAKYEAKGKKPPKNWQEKYKAPEPLSDSELAELPQIPDQWAWAAVEELVEPGIDIVYGIVQPGPNLDEGVPYVRGLDIQDRRILVDQLWKTSSTIAERYSRSSLEGGDVLLGIIRHTKVAVVPDVLSGGNMGRATARFRPSSVITPDFLAGTLEAPQTQNWLLGESRGIDMPIINVGNVRRTPIALAPIDEQNVIGDLIDRWSESCDALRSAHEDAESALSHLDQSILAKAFRGELVPQDPSDEPASELLTRIREARESESKKPRKGGQKKNTKAKRAEQDAAGTSDLLAILRDRGRMHIDDLQAASDLPSKEFYSRLKEAIAGGSIKEEFDENKDRYLESAK